MRGEKTGFFASTNWRRYPWPCNPVAIGRGEECRRNSATFTQWSVDQKHSIIIQGLTYALDYKCGDLKSLGSEGSIVVNCQEIRMFSPQYQVPSACNLLRGLTNSPTSGKREVREPRTIPSKDI
jgi:hypothetical protein